MTHQFNHRHLYCHDSRVTRSNMITVLIFTLVISHHHLLPYSCHPGSSSLPWNPPAVPEPSTVIGKIAMSAVIILEYHHNGVKNFSHIGFYATCDEVKRRLTATAHQRPWQTQPDTCLTWLSEATPRAIVHNHGHDVGTPKMQRGSVHVIESPCPKL